jgi:hypothetical protein
MQYKKHVNILLILIAILSISLFFSFVLDPEAKDTRASSYTWLDSRYSAKANKIVISGGSEKKELFKKDGQWFVSYNENIYPARALRIEDFLGLLTARGTYPVRSKSASSFERLGLDDNSALRVTVSTDNTVLLDLLLGDYDAAGRGVYMRRYGQNEVRSGDNKLSGYVTSAVNSWYNLKLVPESEDGKIDIDNVQRFSVYSGEESQVFSRRNKTWVLSTSGNPDQSGIDAYLRTIINLEADDFPEESGGLQFTNRIVLELGNGKVITIQISESDEAGRRYAETGNGYIYRIPSWAAARLFRKTVEFEKLP